MKTMLLMLVVCCSGCVATGHMTASLKEEIKPDSKGQLTPTTTLGLEYKF